MHILHIDIETYSSVDLTESGAYKYVESPDFEILLVAYAFNDEPIKIVDLASGECLPQEFIDGLYNSNVQKWAHNANFERNAFRSYGFYIPIEQWHCSAVKASYCGLPMSLAPLSAALQLGEKGKLATGKALIRFFCCPVKATKANGYRVRNSHNDDPDKWAEFKVYCVNDVEAEREVCRILEPYSIPDFERRLYILDQLINDRGVRVDADMAQKAIDIDAAFTEVLTERMKHLTGLENPNSPKQLAQWLTEKFQKPITSVTKETISNLFEETDDWDTKEVLAGRSMLSRTSIKKYAAMLACECADGRAHGLFQFYGAGRTGRWAGRLIQLQNLPRNNMPDLHLARTVVKKGDFDLMGLLYDNTPKVLSELIRTALIADNGKVFEVSDFSAIEARVLSWVAQEKWRLDVFAGHGKIYEASAAMMFGVPIESVSKHSELRQRGKIAELALGYGGSAGALATMDIQKKIPANEYKTIVAKWRKANPRVVKLWYDVESTFKQCFRTRKKIVLGCLSFEMKNDILLINLPSGRSLFYQKPRIGENRFGGEGITFWGVDPETKIFCMMDTYGGKLVENIIQAISRDLLGYSMLRLHEERFDMVMHVHDEVVCEISADCAEEHLIKMEKIMGEEVPWAKGLPLTASGYTTPYYKKD